MTAAHLFAEKDIRRPLVSKTKRKELSHTPSWFNRRLRKRLSEAQNHRYPCCGVRMSIGAVDGTEPTLEHLVPLSKGGHDSERNLVVTCRLCNKQHIAWSQWREWCAWNRVPYDWHQLVPNIVKSPA